MASRLYRIGNAPAPSVYPRGLSGLGQRWEDREFDLRSAEAELLELVSDIPGLAQSAVALVDVWLARGLIGPDDRSRLISHFPGAGANETRDRDVSAPPPAEPGAGAPPVGDASDAVVEEPAQDEPRSEPQTTPSPGTRRGGMRLFPVAVACLCVCAVAIVMVLMPDRPENDSSTPRDVAAAQQAESEVPDRLDTAPARQQTLGPVSVTSSTRLTETPVPAYAGAEADDEPTAGSARPDADARLVLSGPEEDVAVSSLEAVENQGTVKIELVRVEGVDAALDIEVMPVSREDGLTNAGNLAFSMVAPVARFEPGQSRRLLEIRLPDDDLLTGTRRYGYYLAQALPEMRLLGRIELAVRDDELLDRAAHLPAGTLSFAHVDGTVSEGASDVRVRLVRYGASDRAFSAKVVISGVGAVEGEDFVGPAEQIVRFPAGSDAEAFFVSLIDDGIAEAEEAIRVSLAAEDVALAAPQQLDIRIIDDDG